MDKIIYGIGGGKMGDPRMADHFRRIVDLAKTRSWAGRPQVAVVPTAQFNGTHPKIGRGNIDLAVDRFRALGCDTRQIRMGEVPAGQSETPDWEIRDILARSQAVFVLGGDTRHLLDVVRKRGLVASFEGALRDGKVMAGTSAGFIWLTRRCMSDAESFHTATWRYVMLEGLGVLPVAGNAHDNGPVPEGLVPRVSRREQFEENFARLGDLPGIAVDEFAAIEVRDFRCRPRSPDNAIGVHVLVNGPDGIARRKMAPGTELDLRDPLSLRGFTLSAPAQP